MAYNPLDAPNVGATSGFAEWFGRVKRIEQPPPQNKGVIYDNSSIDVYDNNNVLQFHAGPDGVSITQNLELDGDLIDSNSLVHDIARLVRCRTSGSFTIGSAGDPYYKAREFTYPNWDDGDHTPVIIPHDIYRANVKAMAIFDIEKVLNLDLSATKYKLGTISYNSRMHFKVTLLSGDPSDIETLEVGNLSYRDYDLAGSSASLGIDGAVYNDPNHRKEQTDISSGNLVVYGSTTAAIIPITDAKSRSLSYGFGAQATMAAGKNATIRIDWDLGLDGLVTSSDAGIMGDEIRVWEERAVYL